MSTSGISDSWCRHRHNFDVDIDVKPSMTRSNIFIYQRSFVMSFLLSIKFSIYVDKSASLWSQLVFFALHLHWLKALAIDVVRSCDNAALRSSGALYIQPFHSKNGKIWSKIDWVRSASGSKIETKLYRDWNCSQLINFAAMGIALCKYLKRYLNSHSGARMAKFGLKLTELGQFQRSKLKQSCTLTEIARDWSISRR